MNVLAFTIIVMNLIGICGGVYIVDKPREPLSATTYLLTAIIAAVNIYLLTKAYL